MPDPDDETTPPTDELELRRGPTFRALPGNPEPPLDCDIASQTDAAKHQVLRILREAYEMAQRGEIGDIMLVLRKHNGETWAQCSEAVQWTDRIALVEVLKMDWYRELVKDNERG